MERLLDLYVSFMFKIDRFFRPDYYEELSTWIQLCDSAGLDPFNPFPQEES